MSSDKGKQNVERTNVRIKIQRNETPQRRPRREERKESVSSSTDHFIHRPVVAATRYNRAGRQHLFLEGEANCGPTISDFPSKSGPYLTETRHLGSTV